MLQPSLIDAAARLTAWRDPFKKLHTPSASMGKAAVKPDVCDSAAGNAVPAGSHCDSNNTIRPSLRIRCTS